MVAEVEKVLDRLAVAAPIAREHPVPDRGGVLQLRYESTVRYVAAEQHGVGLLFVVPAEKQIL